MNDQLIEIAMEIILLAGDSRTMIQKALIEIQKRDFINAINFLDEAEKLINQAHIKQTDIIQKTVRGESINFNLIFIHAQDTLMTINSEYIIANQLVTLFESFYHEFMDKKGEEE